MTADRLPPMVRDLCAVVDNKCRVLFHSETPWISMTFAGSRHTIDMQFLGEEEITAGEALIATLPGSEGRMAGQLMVSASILWTERRFLTQPSLTARIEIMALNDD